MRPNPLMPTLIVKLIPPWMTAAPLRPLHDTSRARSRTSVTPSLPGDDPLLEQFVRQFLDAAHPMIHSRFRQRRVSQFAELTQRYLRVREPQLGELAQAPAADSRAREPTRAR